LTLAHRLFGHGVALAAKIGERNVERPAALVAAAEFIRAEWTAQGHDVRARPCRVGDVECTNLEIAIAGTPERGDHPGSQHHPPLFRWFCPDRGNFVAFVSDLKPRTVLRETVRAFRAHSDFPRESLATFSFVPGVAWSDQLSFQREGYPALMVTHTAFCRYPQYHRAQDTPDRLNCGAMARVVEGRGQKAVPARLLGIAFTLRVDTPWMYISANADTSALSKSRSCATSASKRPGTALSFRTVMVWPSTGLRSISTINLVP
jgi:hypothetical protein